MNFLRKILCKAWRNWQALVEYSKGRESCDRCPCNDGTCPKCGRDIVEVPTPRPTVEEGGFVGLQVTEDPPHQVKRVDDLVDKNFTRHDAPGYINPPIHEGDRILQVDNVEAEHVELPVLHEMLRGPLHTTVKLSLARARTDERYTVVALRHGFRTFQRALGDISGISSPQNSTMAHSPLALLAHSPPGKSQSDRHGAGIYSSQRSPASHRTSSSPRADASPLTIPEPPKDRWMI